MLTVATINVNGLRAAAKKGFVEWLATTPAQVVCLQEVRATTEQLPAAVLNPPGWHAVHAESQRERGRNGVAVLTRDEPDAVRVGFGDPEFDHSGRYVEVTMAGLVVGSLYLPSGDVGTPRQDEKERFMASFRDYLDELRDKSAAADIEVLICGDWNIAHREADLKSWKTNRKNSGFLPSERGWLDALYTESGYIDVVRSLHPDIEGPYSWWSYRGRAYDNDSGWRIDLHVATPALAARAVTATVTRAPTYDTRWSDHAPVTVTYA